MIPIDQVTSARARGAGAVGTLPRWLGDRFHALAFWAAIVLPALYLPLLFAGIEELRGLVVFLALFALHVLALVAGRGHRAPSEA